MNETLKKKILELRLRKYNLEKELEKLEFELVRLLEEDRKGV